MAFSTLTSSRPAPPPQCSRPTTPPVAELTRFLNEVENGGRSADEILPLVYEELRHHAAFRMSRESAPQTLQPTALVHEAWLRMVHKGHNHWENRGHFFAAAAETMRRILIESARRRASLKRGGGQVRVEMEIAHLVTAEPEEKLLLIDESLERLRAEDPDKAQIVVLKFFGGHTNQEVAGMIGVTERTIERQWAFAKAWLFEDIRAQF